MADTNQRPRGGMTLDAIFRQGVFPPWPEKFRDVSPTGWVGQIWRERQAALKIAQVPHEQNEMVRIAKVTGKQHGPGGARRTSIGRRADARCTLACAPVYGLPGDAPCAGSQEALSQAQIQKVF